MSALPIGHTRLIKDTQLVEVDPETEIAELRNKICALPQIEGERKRKEKKALEPVVETKQESQDAKSGDQAPEAGDGAEVKEEIAEVASVVKKEEEEAPTNDTTEEEEQDVDEAARSAEDAEIAASPVLGFVHM